MAGLSLFRRLSEAGQLLEVDVDDVKILLPGSNKIAIGTRGLNGCTCVVILGTAILLAHISPLPGRYEQWTDGNQDVHTASYDHHERSLQRIVRLVGQNVREFPLSSTAWGVFCRGSDGAMQTVIRQVQGHLAAMGYAMRPAFYQEIDQALTRDMARAPKGELVSFRRSGVVELYLESTKLWPKPAESASLSTVQRQMIPTPSSGAYASSSRLPQTANVSSGFWAYSSTVNRILYRSADGGILPEEQWPEQRGRVKVILWEAREWRSYDFGTKEWGDEDENDVDDHDDDEDEGNDDDEDNDDGDDNGENDED